ncbi:MAG TPA: 3'(2'),5'-bisphosphate nucleotidase CysQ [Alphaproteobacteria bacterium]|nr:3'(2'),5'-bisphosphate nucleotidase CysQ [Alphaproteobacteria bacterium]HAJ45355.1 3'(2'),5'-bisphosphate nucleotidase CysQ [Alphaproteobacteria bacterium]
MLAPDTRDQADAKLLRHAVREAGAFILERMKRPYRTTQKPGTPTPWGQTEPSPVTDVDLETDALLTEHLRSARPDYGWLSEETADDPARLACQRVFIADPIDGTTAFLKAKPEFTVVAAVVENGTPRAAAIFNPMTDELFEAARGHGVRRNGVALSVSHVDMLEGARMLGAAEFFAHPGWPKPWPALNLTKRASLAYRLALISAGEQDGYLALTPKHEWDIAAGALLIEEAGGRITTHDGEPLAFNQPIPQLRSIVCAGPALHALILDHIKDVRIPAPKTPQKS